MMNGFTIGRIAKESEVHIETVRYYERRGILKEPRRSRSGYRLYDEQAIRLIRFVKRAQDLGFTLDEIKQLIQLRQSPGRKRNEVRALAERKAGEIQRKIRALQSMQRALDRLVDSCRCGGNELVCPIIDSLNVDFSAATAPAEKSHTEEA